MIPTVFTFHKEPRLTLVGAGPGDPELITVKAINALKEADVVLYDALVSPEILRLIPNGIPAFSVGKRAGEHSHTQDEINQLIVEFAFLYGHVIRLKGGDPFVFGRGSEEIEFAESHGIATRVIPGITSALAVPASLKIPVTARGASESFWVVTGTTKAGKISGDIELAAQSTATVVILMGLHKVDEIMASFCRHGKHDMPVAVIQNGTLQTQRSVIATVETVTEQVKVNKIEAPAVIVIGEVVRYAETLRHIMTKVKSA
ncbi:uroporphyrinogen-III C-methyltransferase [Pseudochryseolinea flava]|uniref:uroporphyrinogen-III C-methyltransferase n=1 Tax=Pseudochryseolinea flava TaxID=2059302 RepID=A0A364XYU1_9BACT|nr:uroporphyrinogen-III C-methyltransferase [Pseudochryseolinea flava]RAV98765.1 uroporphyrinogen-III C-methyltransferase [Pseudochryseolinea flava]